MAKIKKVKRARKHGFLHRSSSASGKRILRTRRRKGRNKLSA
ncbi:MAG: bL34 family ribosomal protein [Alphaproteobacteria bacterium]|nr:bL34 family ribosomal protein [Alphaproteobacteria bacterium]